MVLVIALLTRTLVEDDLAQGRLFEIAISDLPAAFREGMLVQLHSQRKQPAIITDFSDVLREEAGRLCVPMLHSQPVARIAHWSDFYAADSPGRWQYCCEVKGTVGCP